MLTKTRDAGGSISSHAISPHAYGLRPVSEPKADPNEAGLTEDPGLDEASRAWVAGLQTSGAPQERCLADLHALLLRVARHEVIRRASSMHIRGAELDDIVNQVGDDALMAIKAKVSDFRGESRFTTWAYRFVVLEVSSKVGRHFWRRRPAAIEPDGWEQIPDMLAVSPEHHTEHRELLRQVPAGREVVEGRHELAPREVPGRAEDDEHDRRRHRRSRGRRGRGRDRDARRHVSGP